MSKTIRNIPEFLLVNAKKCRKCNSIPVIEDNWWNGWTQSFIKCPNDSCRNIIIFNDEIEKMIDKWNFVNDNIFVPTSKPYNIKQNCYNCKRSKKCQFAMKNLDSQNKIYICNDFLS